MYEVLTTGPNPDNSVNKPNGEVKAPERQMKAFERQRTCRKGHEKLDSPPDKFWYAIKKGSRRKLL